MARPRLLYLGPRDRYWANPPAERSWQRFWGTYELDKTTGLYVEQSSDQVHLKNFTIAFQLLPEELRKLARDWRVTFNFAEGLTANGNSSTFYADFSQRTPDAISPHIEMGSPSLRIAYIIAHLGHEIGHLFWRSRPESQREQYRQFLRESCRHDTVELTEYAQDLFLEFSRAARSKNKPLEALLKKWTEESFCETMAGLIDPCYPAIDCDSTVDLTTRRLIIQSTFGLEILQIPKNARFLESGH